MDDVRAHVGLDVHKDAIAVAIADSERTGEVRFWGNIAHSRGAVERLVRKIVEWHGTVEFTYEAGRGQVMPAAVASISDASAWPARSR